MNLLEKIVVEYNFIMLYLLIISIFNKISKLILLNSRQIIFFKITILNCCLLKLNDSKILSGVRAILELIYVKMPAHKYKKLRPYCSNC
jgi:hypothetical protein